MENTSKRRDRLVIMTEIMSICKTGSSTTHIMFKANLSFAQLKQYLCSLLKTGLLEKVACEGRYVYRSTNKGLEFMTMQQQIINMLNAKGQKCGIKCSPFDVIPFSRNRANILF
jgi:predicted transcriptional regulator